MAESTQCPECEEDWSGGIACTDHFQQMAYWELSDLARFERVHHLMVLTYHLQHPSLYSAQSLKDGLGMLVDFLEGGITPQEMRQRIRPMVDSRGRKHKIIGTPESHGVYVHPVRWAMRAGNVVAAGKDAYCESVEAWARSTLHSLRDSGNI